MKQTKIVLYKISPDKESTRVDIDTLSAKPWDENEQESLHLYSNFIEPGNLVFDIGAHVGSKTDQFLSCGGRVVCIEPQPSCVQELYSKYGSRSDVWIEPVGLGEKKKFQEMLICSGAPTISTFSEEWAVNSSFTEHGYRWDQKIMVKIDTLDSMIQKHGVPSFCKIDAENYELEIFKGLSQKINYLSFEVTQKMFGKTNLCLGRLIELGYRKFNFSIGGRGLFLCPEWVDINTLTARMNDASENYDLSLLWNELTGDIYACP